MITLFDVPSTRSGKSIAGIMEKALKQLQYTPGKSKVFIKPNMVDAVGPREAVDTDPAIVSGLILALDALHDIDEFIVGDGSAYFSSIDKNWERLLKQSGYEKMQENLQRNHGIEVKLVNLEDVAREKVPWKFGNLFLPKLCRTCSYINIAKMKTHLHTMVTLSLKNQKGLLTLQDKKNFHLGKKYGTLHESIMELGRAVKPELALIDATRALEGIGPATAPDGQTKVRRLKMCIAGTSMMEVDNAACAVMGIPVQQVTHLHEAPVQLAQGSKPLLPADPPFARPQVEVKMWNIYRHTYETCCTGCQMALSRTFRKIMFVPELRKEFARFQERYPRADLIMGKVEPEMVEKIQASNPTSTLFFFGNCTKDLARTFNGIHIGGCSPDHNTAIDILFSSMKRHPKC
ncbi:DUF362 domain-containing protein [Candidatus Bathyarchaeota archaeon]|nr:DUF362 domain-containing protein [Candidatus Bathyarchaeota archaeon]